MQWGIHGEKLLVKNNYEVFRKKKGKKNNFEEFYIKAQFLN